MKRRDFLKTSIAASAAVLGSATTAAASAIPSGAHQPNESRKVSDMAFPEKRPLIT